jgi:hypothetical protein
VPALPAKKSSPAPLLTSPVGLSQSVLSFAGISVTVSAHTAGANRRQMQSRVEKENKRSPRFTWVPGT